MMNRTIKDAIDTRLAAITISNELERKILDGANKKENMIKKPLAVMAATVFCIMLSVSVLAASSSNFDRLVSLIGSQIALFLQPIELTSEDNGIKMEVIAAMSDEDTAVAYLSLQDLTSGRVEKNMDLYSYNITGMKTFTSEVISYDAASKTAIIRILANGGSRLNGKKVTVRVDSFIGDKHSFALFDTGVDLQKVIRASDAKTTPFDMANASGGSGDYFWELFQTKGTTVVLKPDEMNIAFPNINFAHISNIGMIDGRLHVQTKWTGMGKDDHGTLALIGHTGVRIDPGNLYFGVDETGNTKFGRNYVEYIFDVKEAELNKYTLQADHFTSYGRFIEGKWQTTFRIRPMGKGKEIGCDLDLQGMQIHKVTVSPLGVTLAATQENHKNTDPLAVSVILRNGSVLTLESAVYQNEDGNLTCKYMSREPIPVENVKEVRINGKSVVPH